MHTRFTVRALVVLFLLLLTSIPGCKVYVAEPKSPGEIRRRLAEQYSFENRYLDTD